VCAAEEPLLQIRSQVSAGVDHRVACHFAEVQTVV
jgi:hypothetical protein